MCVWKCGNDSHARCRKVLIKDRNEKSSFEDRIFTWVKTDGQYESMFNLAIEGGIRIENTSGDVPKVMAPRSY